MGEFYRGISSWNKIKDLKLKELRWLSANLLTEDSLEEKLTVMRQVVNRSKKTIVRFIRVFSICLDWVEREREKEKKLREIVNQTIESINIRVIDWILVYSFSGGKVLDTDMIIHVVEKKTSIISLEVVRLADVNTPHR